MFDRLLDLFTSGEKAREFSDALCGFVDLRYGMGIETLVKEASEPEVIAHSAWSFCGLIESDGLAGFLEQPSAHKDIMLNAIKKIGVPEQVENTQKAETALNASRAVEMGEVYEILKPWDDTFFRLQYQVYKRLTRYINRNLEDFAIYFVTLEKCQKTGENIFNPEIWTATRK